MILSIAKQSQQRKVLLQRLVNDGYFQHNITAIQQGKGEIVVGRRSTVSDKKASDRKSDTRNMFVSFLAKEK